jgi:acetoin utilization protein AcuC
VPKGFNDIELAFVMDEAVLPLAAKFKPEAVVITCGADALAGDPLSGMDLSNGALWCAVEQLVALTSVAVVLGGGGYNPWTVARCWAGLWGVLSGRELPATLPKAAQEMLRTLDCDLIDEDEVEPEWLSTLQDQLNTGDVRESVNTGVAALLR